MNFLQLSQTVNLPRFPVHLSPVLMLEKFYTWEDKRYQQHFTKGEGEKFSYYCDLCTIFFVSFIYVKDCTLIHVCYFI